MVNYIPPVRVAFTMLRRRMHMLPIEQMDQLEIAMEETLRILDNHTAGLNCMQRGESDE